MLVKRFVRCYCPQRRQQTHILHIAWWPCVKLAYRSFSGGFRSFNKFFFHDALRSRKLLRKNSSSLTSSWNSRTHKTSANVMTVQASCNRKLTRSILNWQRHESRSFSYQLIFFVKLRVVQDKRWVPNHVNHSISLYGSSSHNEKRSTFHSYLAQMNLIHKWAETSMDQTLISIHCVAYHIISYYARHYTAVTLNVCIMRVVFSYTKYQNS